MLNTKKSKLAALMVSFLITITVDIIRKDGFRGPLRNAGEQRIEQLGRSKKNSRRKRAVEKISQYLSSDIDSTSQYYIGDTLFVTCTIEHPDAPEFPRSSSDGFTDYIIDGDRLVLNRAPLEPFQENENLVRYDGDYHSLPTSLPKYPKRRLTVNSDLRGLEKVTLALEEEYILPNVTISVKNSRIQISVDGYEKTIEPGQMDSLYLGSREVEVRDRDNFTKSVEVNPYLRICNHGQMEVHGSSENGLLPLHSDDPYAKRRVQSILANSEDAVEQDEENNLLIIP